MLLVILSFLLGIFISNSTKNDLFEGFDCFKDRMFPKEKRTTNRVAGQDDKDGPCSEIRPPTSGISDIDNPKTTKKEIDKYCDGYYENHWLYNYICDGIDYNTFKSDYNSPGYKDATYNNRGFPSVCKKSTHSCSD